MKKLLYLSICTSLLNGQFITIGTGGVTGTYYLAGKQICKQVNKQKNKTSLRCSVEATNGSINNIKSIKNNELDFGIVQSDVVYHAFNGISKYQNNKIKNIRSIMAIYPELFTLVTRKDANIDSYKDLKDKRINIGNSGSGNESTALAMFKAVDFNLSDLKLASKLSSVEMPDALIDNKIDGYFYMVGHPTQNILDASRYTNVKLVELKGEKIKKLIDSNPYFTHEYIKGGLYKNNPNNIETFGVKAVLIANTNVDSKTVYNLIKAVFDNFEEFKKSHQAYSNITKESLLDGLSAPLHEGAKKYYNEIGLLK